MTRCRNANGYARRLGFIFAFECAEGYLSARAGGVAVVQQRSAQRVARPPAQPISGRLVPFSPRAPYRGESSFPREFAQVPEAVGRPHPPVTQIWRFSNVLSTTPRSTSCGGRCSAIISGSPIRTVDVVYALSFDRRHHALARALAANAHHFFRV